MQVEERNLDTPHRPKGGKCRRMRGCHLACTVLYQNSFLECLTQLVLRSPRPATEPRNPETLKVCISKSERCHSGPPRNMAQKSQLKRPKRPFTVGTKIIADPEKYFQELISEKLLIFFAGWALLGTNYRFQ